MNTVITTSNSSAHVGIVDGQIKCRYQIAGGETLCIFFNMNEGNSAGWVLQLGSDGGKIIHIENQIRYVITTFDNQTPPTTGDLSATFNSTSIVAAISDFNNGDDGADYQNATRPDAIGTGVAIMFQDVQF